MEDSVLEKLYGDFDISIKPGKGSYKYVKTHLVLDRLNKVFKGQWSTTVMYSEMIEAEVLVHVKVCINDIDGNILSCHDGFGSAKKTFAATELGNLYKSAKSKAIKDAVRNWGVALFLEEDESSLPTTADAIHPSFSPQPVEKKVSANTVPINSTPPLDTSTSSSTVSTPPTNNVVGNDRSVPSAVNVPGFVTQTPVSKASVLPITPPSVVNEAPTGLPTMPTPKTQNLSMGSGDNVKLVKITMVQEVAIQSKLAHKKIDFNTAMTNMYESAGKDINTAPKNLSDTSYQDALALVNFI